MPHPISTTVTLAAASVNAITTSQVLPGAGVPAALNGTLANAGGTVATLDAPRRILITSAGNDSGITFTVTGTARLEQGNAVQSETITGGNVAAVATTQDFATVTRVVSSGATASTIQIGTNGTGSGPWIVWDQYPHTFQVSMAGFVLSGSPTWGVEYTLDDVFGLWPLPAGVNFPRAIAYSGLTAQTGSGQSAIATNLGPVRATRLTLTVVGSVNLVQAQQGAE